MTVTKNKEGGNSQPQKNIADRLFRLLSSIKLTITVLSFIAVSSILGTVIKQNASVDEYLSLYPQTILKIIAFLGLDDVYHAPWFIGAIIIFAINLAVCTIQRLRRFLRTEKTVRLPDEGTLTGMQTHFIADKVREAEALSAIRQRYRCIYEKEDGLIFERGSFSRYGVYIIHLSILIILLGSLIGLIFGYKGFIALNTGETKDRLTLRGKNPKEVPLGFALRCKSFNVSFYPGGQPKDYVSRLEIIEKGGIVFERDVRVNSPLTHKGMHIYQSSYGATPSFVFKIGNESIVLKEQDEYDKEDFILVVMRFERAVHDFGPGVQVAFLDNGEPKTTWFLKDIQKMRERMISGRKVVLEDIKEDLWTGLEVSYDPGVWVTWSGFALILFGLYINFFIVHRRIFIRRCTDNIIIAGIAFKHRDVFREEFERLKGKVCGNAS